VGTDIFLLACLLLSIYELRSAILNPIGVWVRVGLCVIAIGARFYAYTLLSEVEEHGISSYP
jgi:hypothetical protein